MGGVNLEAEEITHSIELRILGVCSKGLRHRREKKGEHEAQVLVKTATTAEDAAEAGTLLQEIGEAMSPDLLRRALIDTCLARTKADPPVDGASAEEREEGDLERGEREVENELEGTEETRKDIDW